MKSALCFGLLLASGLWADELTDRTAITQTIFKLDESQPALFTADFSDSAEFRRVSSVGTVVISKEPFGEATIILPPAGAHRFVVQSTRFLTGEVALVDALDRNNGYAIVLLVMKKEGAEWKLASYKRIAEDKKTAP
jgi:hypothetical protein